MTDSPRWEQSDSSRSGASTDELRHPTLPNAHLPVGVCRLCAEACEPRRRWHEWCKRDWDVANRSAVGRLVVFERDGFMCQNPACPAPGPYEPDELRDDHRVPLDQAGIADWNDLSNRQTLCIPCHDEKTRIENVTRNASATATTSTRQQGGSAPAGTEARAAAPLYTAPPPFGAALWPCIPIAAFAVGSALLAYLWDRDLAILTLNLGVLSVALRIAGWARGVRRAHREEADYEMYACLSVVTRDPAGGWRSHMHSRWAWINPRLLGVHRRHGRYPIDVTLKIGRLPELDGPKFRAALISAFASHTRIPAEEVDLSLTIGRRARLRKRPEKRPEKNPAPATRSKGDAPPPARAAASEVEEVRRRIEEALRDLLEDPRVEPPDVDEDGNPRRVVIAFPPTVSPQARSLEERVAAILAELYSPDPMMWRVQRHRSKDQYLAVVVAHQHAADVDTFQSVPLPVPVTDPEPDPERPEQSAPTAAPVPSRSAPLSPEAAAREAIRTRIEDGVKGVLGAKVSVPRIDDWHTGEDPATLVVNYPPGLTAAVGDKLTDLRDVVTQMLPPAEGEWGVVWEPARDRIILTDRPDPLAEILPFPVIELNPDLRRGVNIGRVMSGGAFLLQLIDGIHLLVVGASGAGKGSVLWGIVRALRHMIADRRVRLWIADPKGGMECAALEPIVTRFLARVWEGEDKTPRIERRPAFAVTQKDIAIMLAGLVEVMQAKAASLRGKARKAMTPTVEFPLDLLLADEVGAFLAFGEPALNAECARNMALAQSQGRAPLVTVVAFTQDTRKEVLKYRGLFTSQLALRLMEAGDVDMVLGKGARTRGATADLISEGLPGVCYRVRDGKSTIDRARVAYTSDEDIEEMVAWILAEWEEKGLQAPDTRRVPAGEQLTLAEVARTGRADGTHLIEPVQRPARRAHPERPDPDPAIDSDLLRQAAGLVVQTQFGSTSMLQRKMRIGYAVACRVMAALEGRGIVGPENGSKPREVLVKAEDGDRALAALRGGGPEPEAERSPVLPRDLVEGSRYVFGDEPDAPFTVLTAPEEDGDRWRFDYRYDDEEKVRAASLAEQEAIYLA